MKLTVLVSALLSVMPVLPAGQNGSADRTTPANNRVVREVRHELVMLPYYGVFDNLAYRVDGDTVTLMGQVTRPTLKSDAGNVVQKIEGVERVVNDIEVLPLSPNDERIRRRMYRAIYGNSSLSRYALSAVPPIHIIVKNGNVSLEGVVANEGDKNIAGIRAKGVETRPTSGSYFFSSGSLPGKSDRPPKDAGPSRPDLA